MTDEDVQEVVVDKLYRDSHPDAVRQFFATTEALLKVGKAVSVRWVAAHSLEPDKWEHIRHVPAQVQLLALKS